MPQIKDQRITEFDRLRQELFAKDHSLSDNVPRGPQGLKVVKARNCLRSILGWLCGQMKSSRRKHMNVCPTNHGLSQHTPSYVTCIVRQLSRGDMYADHRITQSNDTARRARTQLRGSVKILTGMTWWALRQGTHW